MHCFTVGCSQWLDAVGGEDWATDLQWLLWWWSEVSSCYSAGARWSAEVRATKREYRVKGCL